MIYAFACEDLQLILTFVLVLVVDVRDLKWMFYTTENTEWILEMTYSVALLAFHKEKKKEAQSREVRPMERRQFTLLDLSRNSQSTASHSFPFLSLRNAVFSLSSLSSAECRLHGRVPSMSIWIYSTSGTDSSQHSAGRRLSESRFCKAPVIAACCIRTSGCWAAKPKSEDLRFAEKLENRCITMSTHITRITDSSRRKYLAGVSFHKHSVNIASEQSDLYSPVKSSTPIYRHDNQDIFIRVILSYHPFFLRSSHKSRQKLATHAVEGATTVERW